MIDRELLEILCCPATRQALREATAQELSQLRQLQSQGKLSTVSGHPFQTGLDGGLVRADGTIVYPIVGGIPVLLADEGLVLTEQFA
jgi:uncharacterized protein YbaR (Trm112 family)